MSALILLVPIAIFLALAALFVLLLRRSARLMAIGREHDQFRGSAADLARRVDASLGGVAERIDAVRRRTAEPASIQESVQAAEDAVGRYAEEAQALEAPADYRYVVDALVEELGRASRALAMVAYGCAALVAAHRATRDLEAQTAIKRGYLNLVHAREAINRHATDLSRLPMPTAGAWRRGRAG